VGRWSWQSYLVHDGFADWVDRGRPRPTHRQWSQYLRWVASQVPVEPIIAEVDGIDLADGRWRLATRTPAGRLPSRTWLERAIGHDLAVAGLHPRLHLPVLAGVAQGPGFPNLSCLGLLADRVLGAYPAPWAGVGTPATDKATVPGHAS